MFIRMIASVLAILLWLPLGGTVIRKFDFNTGTAKSWSVQPADATGLKLCPANGELQLLLTPGNGKNKMACTEMLSLSSAAGEQMLRVSGKIQRDALQASRFELKVLAGMRGGQVFCDGALQLKNDDGTFLKYWKLPAGTISCRLFFILDGGATGTVRLDDLHVEQLPYEESALADPIPENGTILYRSDFARTSAGWRPAAPGTLTLEAANQALRAVFGTPGKPGKSLVSPAIPLPRLASGMQGILRISTESRGDHFKGRRLEVKPLFSSGAGQEFPPPYPTLPHDASFRTMSAEWHIDDRCRYVTIYIAADGDSEGAYELRSVKVELLPAPRAAITTGFPSNVVPADQADVSVTPFRPALLKDGSIAVTAENGREILRQPLRDSNRIRLPEPGFYRFEVNARYRDGSVVKTPGAVVVAGAPLPPAVFGASRVGVVGVNADARLLHAVGARWNWLFTGFSGVKRQPLTPSPDWNRFAVPLPTENIWTAGDLPTWLQPASPERNAIWFPTDVAGYRAVLKLLASTPGFPRYYNIFNEPEGKWRNSWEDFVRWHKISRDAIHEAAPRTVVTGPALSSINMHLIRKLGSLGFFDAVDAVNIHPYVEGTPPEQEFIRRIDDLERYLAEIGKGDMPLFLTEFGWTTGAGGWQKPISQSLRDAYVARSLALLHTTGMTGCAYFSLYYRNVNPGEAGFSLIASDGAPTPGAAALAAACRHLGALRERARRLAFSPRIHWIAGKTASGEMLLAAWATEGRENIRMPFPVRRVYSMTGRPVPVAADGRYELTAEPLYFYSAETQLAELRLEPPRKLLPGESLPDNGLTRQVAFAPLTAVDGKISCAPDAEPGEYLVAGVGGDGGWIGQRFHVPGHWDLGMVQLRWPIDGAPELHGTIRSNQNRTETVGIDVEFNGTRLPGLRKTLEPDTAKPFVIRLPEHMAQQGGAVRLRVNDGSSRRPVETTCEIALLPAPRQSGDAIDWSRIPARSWGAFPAFSEKTAELPPPDPADLSARLQAAYTASGLHLRVEVRDDIHRQTDRGAAMWDQDSLQFAFDVDCTRRWEPNAQFGLNGHRIFEYTLGAVQTGVGAAWRHLAYDPVLRDNVAEPRVKVAFERHGDRSEYRLFFPWATLGLAEAPARGGEIGFSALLNDRDPGTARGRHGLRFFRGIHPEKEPEKFGRIFLR